ncbi:hypothetical protein GH714_030930 [Hevea brasiliensis]|uniref:Bifunctional inhibitor/plant lipid transfer protein/seed storage helical domain-containing protein n=1 Tax=Hevea brasiliensis TaxID=3981 RepID=A0A6A6LFX7_HEVBR|nr:hypothetical protein GH714_030930 [Hevea brasiliensis]
MGNMKAIRPLASLVIVLLVAGVMSIWDVKTASAALSAAQCKEERRLGLNACKPVVYGRPPSPQCCERIRVTHIECVCPDVTPKIAALIDMNRAVRIIEGCGRRVSPLHENWAGCAIDVFDFWLLSSVMPSSTIHSISEVGEDLWRVTVSGSVAIFNENMGFSMG